MSSRTRKARSRCVGATLIEIMLASVILAIIALAGGAFVYRSRADIALQKNRRAAIELANDRLEELMYDWTYAQVAARVGGGALNENLSINGQGSYRRRTTVSLSGGGHDDCLRIVVQMRYNPRDNSDEVWLETLRGR
jgi:type II secretory pathway pseudopilin PulG